MASKPYPAIQVYARPVGYLQWVCPNCREIYGAKTIPWRRARITCGNCGRAYRLGLNFTQQKPTAWPPMNACLGGPWNGYTANRLDIIAGSTIARIRARLDWVCPTCSIGQSGALNDSSVIICIACRAFYYVSVILYGSTPGGTIKCPLDWIIPHEFTKNPIDTLDFAEIN